MGPAERRFHDQDVRVRQLGRLRGQRRVQLEVARVKQRAAVAFGQQHGGAQAMAGRICGQPQSAKLERLAIGHFQHAVPRPHAMPIKTGRAGRCQRQFVPRDVIAMRMRHKAPRLAAAHVDRQLGVRQK